MTRYFIFALLMMLINNGFSQGAKKTELVIGDKLSLFSENLGISLDLYIGLPKNYQNSRIDYPVHYVLDGQILFSYYSGVIDMLSKGEIPECIVVGIQSVKRGYYYKPGNGAKDLSPILFKKCNFTYHVI